MTQQKHEPLQNFKSNVNFVIGFAQCIAVFIAVWLRCGGSMGGGYLGVQFVIGMGAMLLYYLFLAPGYPEVMFFWLLTLVMYVLHKAKHAYKRRVWQYRPHSRYMGKSGLSFLGGDAIAKRLWEPLLVLFAGFYVKSQGNGLGPWLIFSAVCLVIAHQYAAMEENARIQAVEDAREEQAWLMKNLPNH
ncbi:hypothetical protein [Fimbriiglobus ruber]|uniref:Uncharacterized protein n=1 Tax=Fimbriiglobus ruber TaxID=1908690 RepID=A0A225DPP4_9BACT|nr:hypothetical protein [Fimbriiglobus ruber]OWK39466.1 hypothetical protein FRUB_06029 [Fimbriiglobus ruber]